MDKKQLKRIFNKNIVKDKSFIKMVCFTIVLLLVLVLGNTFGYVSADTTSYSHCLNKTDWQSSPFYDSNYYCDWFGGSISENDTIIFDYFCNNDVISSSNPVASSAKYYLLLGYDSASTYSTYLNLYLFDDESIYFVSNPYSYSNGWTIYTKSSSYYVCSWETYGDGTNLQSIRVGYDADYPTIIETHISDTKVINGETYYYFSLGDTNNFPLLTNMSYYAFDNSVPYGSYTSYMDAYLTDGSYESNIYQCNYMLDYAPDLGGFSSLEGVSTPTTMSIETEANNMYADYSDWILNNYTGDIATNYRNVSVSFTSNLNDYIREHYDDNEYDNYSIWLDYNVFIDFYYDGVVDNGTISASLGNEFANVQYSHDIVTTNTYHWSCNYVFTPSNNDSSYISSGYLLPMDTFIEEKNCVFTLGLDGLFAYLSPSDGSGNMISTNGTRYHTNLTLSQLMQLINENCIIWDSNYEGLNQFKMTCTAKIIYDDFSGDGYSGSGTYIETFNLLDGTSTVDSNNMLTNYNPYITNTDEDVTSSLPSTSTGSSVSSASNGNITQTVNVTNEGAKYIPSIISSLIPSSFGDTTTGLASRFTTLVDSNNFITVMANTVPAVPTTVWTYLTEYLGISLYLLACAFVLRLILDLL